MRKEYSYPTLVALFCTISAAAGLSQQQQQQQQQQQPGSLPASVDGNAAVTTQWSETSFNGREVDALGLETELGHEDEQATSAAVLPLVTTPTFSSASRSTVTVLTTASPEITAAPAQVLAELRKRQGPNLTISSLSSALSLVQASLTQLSQNLGGSIIQLQGSVATVQMALSRSAAAATSSASSAVSSASAAVAAAQASASSAQSSASSAVASALSMASAASASADASMADAMRTKADAESRISQAQGAAVSVTQAAIAVIASIIGSSLLSLLGFYLFVRYRRNKRREEERKQLEAENTERRAEAAFQQRLLAEEARRRGMERAASRVSSSRSRRTRPSGPAQGYRDGRSASRFRGGSGDDGGGMVEAEGMGSSSSGGSSGLVQTQVQVPYYQIPRKDIPPPQLQLPRQAISFDLPRQRYREAEPPSPASSEPGLGSDGSAWRCSDTGDKSAMATTYSSALFSNPVAQSDKDGRPGSSAPFFQQRLGRVDSGGDGGKRTLANSEGVVEAEAVGTGPSAGSDPGRSTIQEKRRSDWPFGN